MALCDSEAARRRSLGPGAVGKAPGRQPGGALRPPVPVPARPRPRPQDRGGRWHKSESLARSDSEPTSAGGRSPGGVAQACTELNSESSCQVEFRLGVPGRHRDFKLTRKCNVGRGAAPLIMDSGTVFLVGRLHRYGGCHGICSGPGARIQSERPGASDSDCPGRLVQAVRRKTERLGSYLPKSDGQFKFKTVYKKSSA
jgi:hypothetical protein